MPQIQEVNGTIGIRARRQRSKDQFRSILVEAIPYIKPTKLSPQDQLHEKVVWEIECLHKDLRLTRNDRNRVIENVMAREEEIQGGRISVEQAVEDEINAFLAKRSVALMVRS